MKNSQTIERLRDIFSEILLCDPATLNLDRPYIELGIDSILAIQVARSIQILLGQAVMPADIYNAVTIRKLAMLIDDRRDFPPQETQSSTPTSLSDCDIAITGIAGQFPDALHVDALWALLRDGRCAIRSSARWNTSFKGGFLDSIDTFDGDFFHLSPKAITLMDPQQRLLLETAYLAFQDAGLTREQLDGSRCGVFVTSLPGDYRTLIQQSDQPSDILSFTGNAVSIYSARISYFFNLKGPSLYLDTACSSSLVCLEQAIRHLNDRTCDIALVGASSIFSTDEMFQLTRSAKLLSPTGECRSFDVEADGFVPAEMVACVILQRLEDAKTLPYGTLKAIGVNHDGLTNGIMSPNSVSQEELIRNIYEKYTIDLSQIGYIEAHGTGTPIGDPIEMQALEQAYSGYHGDSIAVGSLKANIGHGLVASGLAGLFKILKTFEHQIIPPQIHYKTPNPQFPVHLFRINTDVIAWPKDKTLAALSAFGFGGTNAHLVVEKPRHVRKSAPLSEPFQKKSYWIGKTFPKSQNLDKQLVIQEKLASLLGYSTPQEIPLNKPLAYLGIDSLVALQLLEALSPAYQALSPQDIFSKTLEELIDGVPSIQASPHEKHAITLEWVCEGPQGGKPLVFLPPLNTVSDGWIQQKRYFQAHGWRLFIPHYPGHGNSSYAPYSLEKLARILAQDLQGAFSLKEAVPIVGWSLGGCLGLLLAIFVPQLVYSLVLVGTAAHFGQDLFAESTQLREELSTHKAYLSRLFQNSNPLSVFSANCSLEILAHYYKELEDFSYVHALHTISSMCLIVYGGKDSVIHASHILDLQTIPRHRIVSFEEEGHFIPLTAPWVFNKTLMHFLGQETYGTH